MTESRQAFRAELMAYSKMRHQRRSAPRRSLMRRDWESQERQSSVVVCSTRKMVNSGYRRHVRVPSKAEGVSLPRLTPTLHDHNARLPILRYTEHTDASPLRIPSLPYQSTHQSTQAMPVTPPLQFAREVPEVPQLWDRYVTVFMVAFAMAKGKVGNHGARRESWVVLVERWLAAILRIASVRVIRQGPRRAVFNTKSALPNRANTLSLSHGSAVALCLYMRTTYCVDLPNSSHCELLTLFDVAGRLRVKESASAPVLLDGIPFTRTLFGHPCCDIRMQVLHAVYHFMNDRKRFLATTPRPTSSPAFMSSSLAPL